MQFLRSILFPRISKNNKRLPKDETQNLRRRVKLLEEENKKSEAVIQELTSCVRSMSLVLSDMSADVAAFKHFLMQLSQEAQSSDQIFSKYMMSPDDDDDGGGYLN